MCLGSIRGTLLQTLMPLLVIKEQVGSTRAIYLHMFQLPKNQITLEYMHDHPCIPRECGRAGSTRVISHCHFQHQDIFPTEVSPVPSLTSANVSAPARKNVGPHSMACTPLGHLGNTSLPNLRAYRDPSQVYNS